MMRKNIFQLFLLSLFVISCGGGSDGGGETPGGDGGGNSNPDPDPILNPTAATLTAPENNNACLDGENVSFIWEASQNTDSYEVVVKDLNSKMINSYPVTETNTSITLATGVPYSWYVKSISNSTTTTASSPTWKFFLVGTPDSNYAPYPAEISAPAPGAVVQAGSITLSWVGSDPDADDTLSYQVILDETNPPTTIIKENTSSSSMSKTLSSGTYYWKVLSTDDKGSNSDSGVSYFEVN